MNLVMACTKMGLRDCARITEVIFAQSLSPRCDRGFPAPMRLLAWRGDLARFIFFAALASVAGGGCATRNQVAEAVVLPDDGSRPAAVQRAQQTIERLFPARYRATQRAIITARGKQFTCDGVLTVSPAEGYHLALVSSFGAVTDLRVKADEVALLKVTPLFRADWSRNFVARDLRELFVAPDRLQSAGRLADGRLVLRTGPGAGGAVADYVFSADGSRWEELFLANHGKTFYRAVARHYLKFAGMAAEIPDEFEVSAESYRLDLRITSLQPEAQR